MSPDDKTAPEEVNESGLTPLEQAQFDAMQAGTEVPEVVPDNPDPVGEAGGDNPDPEAGADDKAKKTEPAATDQTEPESERDMEVVVAGQKQKRVSIHKYQRLEAKLKETETKAQTLERERAEAIEKQNRIDERLKIINEALATPGGDQQQQEQAEDDPMPDPEKDIFGYAAWQGRQLQQANERIERLENGGKQRDAEIELANTYQQDAGRFAQTEPAFASAYVYLIKQRDAELQIAGVKDKTKRDRQIVAEEKGLVKGAIEDGVSPAERIFQMACGRGFNAEATRAALAAQKGDTTNGKAKTDDGKGAVTDPKSLAAKPAAGAEAKPAAAAKPSVTEEIENIRKGTEAATSLSNVAGGSVPNQLTPQMLADMSQDEFDDLVARLPKHKLDALLSGQEVA